MRTALGFTLLNLGLLGAGAGLLRGLGLLEAGRGAALIGAGPAWLAGTAAVISLLDVLLVIGVPVTLLSAGLTAGLVAGGGAGAAALRRRRMAGDASGDAVNDLERRSAGLGGAGRRLRGIGLAAVSIYAALGAYALARSPTRGDDARIWSFKGLTLGYYDTLRPEVFTNPAAGLSHQVYPLFQPTLDGLLVRAIGRPDLRLTHVELWLVLLSSAWTAGYLLWWRQARPLRDQLGIVTLGLLLITAPLVSNIWIGDADATGSLLLAAGALALALWLERREAGLLGLGAVLLAASAGTKDEDFVGVCVVLALALAALAARRQTRAAGSLAVAAAAVAVIVAPWRIWVSAHHLRDSVVPPLPRALSPGYLLDRTARLHQTASSMLSHVLGDWTWLAAIFLALCVLCLVIPAGRLVAAFYLSLFSVLVLALLWLYTATPLDLGFLIPTSMGRTVSVFMSLTPLACAHMLTRMSENRPVGSLSAAGP